MQPRHAASCRPERTTQWSPVVGCLFRFDSGVFQSLEAYQVTTDELGDTRYSEFKALQLLVGPKPLRASRNMGFGREEIGMSKAGPPSAFST